MTLDFLESRSGTIGIELELQLIDLCNYDLSPCASYLIPLLEISDPNIRVTPELTESMIEVSAGILTSWYDCMRSMHTVQSILLDNLKRLNVGVCGGGAHPFQRWQQQRIFDNNRFRYVSDLYGYLAKQFTVFGQHVHIGCASSKEAMFLLHSLNRFIPHFIALAASSPFFQGTSTRFHSSRLHSIAAFPMSGRAPFFLEWDKFLKNFYEPILQTGIVRSMKDFYWDIRPKPEYGTIELRICDTPLSLFDAGLIAGFMQILCRAILADGIVPDESEYMVYTHNRFQATRFGFQAEYVDPVTRKSCNLRESFTSTIDWLREFEDSSMMENILLDEIEAKVKKCTDAELLVEQFQRSGNMEDVVFWSMNRFQAPFQDRVMEVLNCSSKR